MPSSVCLPCRLKLLARISTQARLQSQWQWFQQPARALHTHLTPSPSPPRRHTTSHRRRHFATEAEEVSVDETITTTPPAETTRDRAKDAEAIALGARRMFGDHLPDGVLNAESYRVYERLYGTPRKLDEAGIYGNEDVEGHDYGGKDVLLRETEDGRLEEVLVAEESDDVVDEQEGVLNEEEEVLLTADEQLRRDMEAVDDEGYEVDELEEEGTLSGEADRAHPLTLAARFTTSPSTIQLPKDTLVGPVGVMLSDMANKHLDEAAAKVFGGPGLPYSTGTPVISRSMPQKPIPLSASHSKMTSIEADVFAAAIMPGTYAAVTSALVESRKRLGSAWLEELLRRPGGPRILDAGGGGAGALAWRQIVKAEWERMHDSSSSSSSSTTPTPTPPPPPYGETSVLTASPTLRERASVLLDRTTFLPRLPDYVHAPPAAQVKQFDVIIAPHALWHIPEDYLRKQAVANLWALLNPRGGLLLVLEKGVPRGFEVVAAARDALLTSIAPPSRPELSVSSPDTLPQQQAVAHVVAPCTNQTKCPMYLVPGTSRGRKDYCHFSQRYIRPPFLQRLLGAKDRNHEDVKFSYVAVQKNEHSHGPSTRESGEDATAQAFAGYGEVDVDSDGKAPAPALLPLLPRSVDAPLKRRGHVIIDVCTPAGKLERWTVPKSFGRQAYRDARKSRWGDLWALGAKTRIPRAVRLGKSEGNFKAEESEGDVAGRRRREAKDKGRLKARGRRREETRRLFAGEDSLF